MESNEYTETTKKCYQIGQRLLESVNLCYDEPSSTFIFWNKYQIYLHEDFNLEEASKTLVPDFQINQILAANNYLVCLDVNGNVHLAQLNLKNSGTKKFKSGFQQRANGILCFTQSTPDTVVSLKSNSESSFSLCLHKVNAYFQIEKETVLKLKEKEPLPQTTQDKCLLYSKLLSDADFEDVKEIFQDHDLLIQDSSIVLISFDKIHVYACMYNPKSDNEEIELVQVYNGSSQICNITLEEGGMLLVGLKCGTVCKQPLKSKDKTQVVHLNTALHKFTAFKDTLLYTDGISLWKSEDTFSKSDIKFEKLFVKQPKDFIKVGQRIVSTTYTNIIYSFLIDDRNSYENQEKLDEYCSAEKLLKNSEYLHKIMKEVEKNDDVIKKLNDERNHITALSLSKRPDIMEKVIQTEIVMYEDYEEVITDNSDITLTENMHHYFEPASFLLLIKMTTNVMQQTINEVLTNLLSEAKIHINLFNENKLLKTTSVKLKAPLKKSPLLVPLHKDLKSTEIQANIKLVLNLPGCMDAEESVCIVLYAKDIILNSEHFIKTPKNMRVNVLKEPKENIEDLIFKNVCHHHGNLFDISEANKSNTNDWSFYVKLPGNFKDIFNKDDYYKNRFSRAKEVFLHTNLSSEQFLKSKHKLIFEVGREKVVLEIMNDDFCSPLLKISSGDVRISFNIRNFLANVVYNDFKECRPGKEYLNYTLYTTTENLQKAVRQSLSRGSQEELQSLTEKFHKNVIGAFPI